MQVPGLKVAVPSTPADAKGLLTSCVFDDDPCVHMETMSLLFTRGPLPEGNHVVPLGVADVKRPGADVTVVTWGWQVPEALAAAETLVGEGTDVEVLDLRTLVPLDRRAVLESVARTRRLLVVHAATRFAGPGAEIAAFVAEELFGQLDGPGAPAGVRLHPGALRHRARDPALPRAHPDRRGDPPAGLSRRDRAAPDAGQDPPGQRGGDRGDDRVAGSSPRAKRSRAGQPLYLLETDKVEIEVESPAAGRAHLLGEAGQTYLVGTDIGYIDGPAG